MEEHFLKETKFIHSDQISIAGLLAVCEFTQFWMTGEKNLVSGRPKVTQWLSDVQSALSPHFVIKRVDKKISCFVIQQPHS